MEPLTESQLEALKARLVTRGREFVASCNSETKRLISAMDAEGRPESHRRSEEARILLEAYRKLLPELVRQIESAGGSFANTGYLFPAVAQSVANQLIGPRRPRLYYFKGLPSFQKYTELNAWVGDLERQLRLAREEVEKAFTAGRGF